MTKQTIVANSLFPNLDESVLWLDISMEEAVLVHEGDSLHHLEHDVADLGLREGPTSLKASKTANGWVAVVGEEVRGYNNIRAQL